MSATLGLDTNQTAIGGRLDPRGVALIGVHFQRGIVSPGGFFGERFSKPLHETGALTRYVELLVGARQAGASIFHINICNPPETITNNPLFKHALESGSLQCGTPEVETAEEIPAAPGDVTLMHHRTSAFVDTNLAGHLQHRRIHTVAIAGVSTHVAVEGTAREAIDVGYDVLLLEDCCVAPTASVHADAVERMRMLVTEVTTSASLLARLGGPGGGNA